MPNSGLGLTRPILHGGQELVDRGVDLLHPCDAAASIRVVLARELAVALLDRVRRQRIARPEAEDDARVGPDRPARSRGCMPVRSLLSLLLELPRVFARLRLGARLQLFEARMLLEQVDEIFDAGVDLLVADPLAAERA